MSNAATALEVTDVHKCFRQGTARIDVLNGVTFTVAAGERVAILGRSGSGKSTLLHVLAGLDDTDQGQVLVVSEDMTAAKAEQRAAIRNRHMGFIYQAHHLLPEFFCARKRFDAAATGR